MSIDKIFKQWAEDKEENTTLSSETSERCWENIINGIDEKRSWYDRLIIKLKKANQTFHIETIAEIALIILLVVSIPRVANITKEFLNKSAAQLSGQNQVPDKVDNNGPKEINTDGNQVIDDPRISNAVDIVRQDAEKKYQKFTTYTSGVIDISGDDGDPYLDVYVYENTNNNLRPRSSRYTVNIRTYQFKENDTMFRDSKYSWDVEILIQAINNDYKTQLYTTNDNEINIDGSYIQCEVFSTEGKYPYYYFNKDGGRLYKKETDNSAIKLIYQCDPQKNTPAATTLSEDIDGDGKMDKIVADSARRTLTINETTIELSPVNIDTHVNVEIVDIDKNDGIKELQLFAGFIDISAVNDYYYYKDGMIYRSGRVSSIAEGYKAPAINSDGIVVSNNNIWRFLEVHLGYAKFKLNKSHELRVMTNGMQEFRRFTKDKIKAKVEVPLLKSRDSKEIAATLKIGESVKLISTDNSKWILVENSDGVQGWLEIEFVNGYDDIVKALNLGVRDVFEGLFYAS